MSMVNICKYAEAVSILHLVLSFQVVIVEFYALHFVALPSDPHLKGNIRINV